MRVALCAGLGLASSAWAPVLRLLPLGTEVVLVDRPGLGALRGEPVRPLTLVGEAARVAEAVAASGGGPAVLVGHSMGGFIVEATARLHPGLVAGLVLVDSSVERDPAPLGTYRREVHALAAGAVERLRLGPRVAALVAEDASYPELAAELEQVRRERPLPEVPVEVLAAARSLSWPGTKAWLRDQLWLGDVLGADVEVVWGSGHRMMRDAPEKVADAIVRVCARG